VYDKAISIDDKMADLYHYKGITLMNLKRNEEALQCFKMATDLDERLILSYAAKAEVEQLLGRGPEALASLKQANRLLDDPLATKSLSESQVKYIKKSFESFI
jgi:tetratricopeptide (TPR) repeat protein